MSMMLPGVNLANDDSGMSVVSLRRKLSALGAADHDVEFDFVAVRGDLAGQPRPDDHTTRLHHGARRDEQDRRGAGEQEAEEHE